MPPPSGPSASFTAMPAGRLVDMFSTLIVTQGDLAHQLVEGVRNIVPEPPVLSYLGLSWDDDLATATAKILEAVDRHSASGEGTLVLVDMVGSTPCNAARSLLDQRSIEVVAGVNLPMVVRLACAASVPPTLHEAAEWLMKKAQGTICRPEGPSPQGEPETMDEED